MYNWRRYLNEKGDILAQNDVLEKLNALPPEAQQQVVDFIKFLQTRYQPKPGKKAKSKLAGEAFIGIWRNREDMRDSSAWVRESRSTEWGESA